jgi:anhydro-N-acetylmuramic acid kinase
MPMSGPDAAARLPRYLRALIDYVEKPERLVVGLLAGTSADGVSSVLARISGDGGDTRATVLACRPIPYPEPLATRIHDVFSRDTATIDRVAQADNVLGRFYADAARQIAADAGAALADLDLIASAGQVTYQVIEGQRAEHRWMGERAETAFVMLGSGSFIAELTGVTTVSNIHRRDLAAGGIGVPGLTFADWALCRHPTRGRAIHNIGGITNPTVIPAGASMADVYSFDAGPGNMMIDGLMAMISNGATAYDEDGRLAAAGRIDRTLLSELLEHPFLAVDPPRGAARQLFGREYTARMRERGHALGLSEADIAATFTAFSAESMALAYRRYILPRTRIDEILLAGGGAHNTTLRRRFAALMDPVPVGVLDDIGFPVDAREALSVAVIGNETMLGGAANNPGATGATRSVICGDISPCGAG